MLEVQELMEEIGIQYREETEDEIELAWDVDGFIVEGESPSDEVYEKISRLTELVEKAGGIEAVNEFFGWTY